MLFTLTLCISQAWWAMFSGQKMYVRTYTFLFAENHWVLSLFLLSRDIIAEKCMREGFNQ